MKKVLNFILALLFTLSFFTGCAKTDDTNITTNENNIVSQEITSDVITNEEKENTSENQAINSDKKEEPVKEEIKPSVKPENPKKDTINNSKDTQNSSNDTSNKSQNIKDNNNSSKVPPKIEDEKLYCTLLIDCKTILDNMDELSKNKVSIVPKDGIILNKKVEYKEGETVYDVLMRETRRNRIHIDSLDGYIKGIGNLYEKDCGKLSGWMYCVNGKFLSYSCKDAKVSKNDVIEWRYTCDLGKDIGDQYNG